MKIKKIRSWRQIAGLLLAANTLYSCAPGSTSSRKKMPPFTTSSEFESPMLYGAGNRAEPGNASLGFTTNNVDMMLDGEQQQFVSVALPSSADDQQIINLVNSFKLLALPLISDWAHQQRRGVMVDLANHTGAVNRTDYVIEKTDDFIIPLVIMWDSASASRVVKLKSLLDGIPAVKLSCTSGFDPR